MNGLFGSAILDTAIGLIFIYLLLAVFCTAVNEWIAGFFRVRANFLKRGLQGLLEDPGGASNLITQFYGHPVIASMLNAKAHPSYIPARSFARAILDLVTPTVSGPLDFDALETGIKSLPPGRIRTALLSLIQDAGGNLERAQRNIEGWYDDTMDRVSGEYKRYAQIVTIFVALAITVATNADTLSIGRRLWVDPALRAVIVEQSKLPSTAATNQSGPLSGTAKSGASMPSIDQIAMQDRQVLGDVLGWNKTPGNDVSWLERILGWILSVIAISLGAPFWFDALNRFMNIRNAGKSPNEQAKVPEKPKLAPNDKTA